MNHDFEKFNNLIESLELLPSIGKKSARNIALYLIKENKYAGIKIAHAIEDAIQNIKNCKFCGGLSEHEICEICSDENRDKTKLCITQNEKDIFIIEDLGFFHGRYFVFENMQKGSIEKLKNLVKDGIEEVIFAFPPSLQNDALIYYMEEKLGAFDLAFTKIAQGIPTGVSLENVDTLSLSRAIEGRIKI